MANFQPPPTYANPVEVDERTGRFGFAPVWLKWFVDLAGVLSASGGSSGNIIHNNTSGIQGGTSGQAYHVLQTEHAEIQRMDNTLSVAVDTALTDNECTVLVIASGKLITLPAASSARQGKAWTVVLAVNGYVDITVSGVDTIVLPTNDTTIRLDRKSMSLTFRCSSASSWVIV